MSKYCAFVGLTLAVFVTTTTALPVKRRDHDIEDFRRHIDEIDPGVVRQAVTNPSEKRTGADIPTLWEEDVMKFRDPNGKNPSLRQPHSDPPLLRQAPSSYLRYRK